MKLTPEYQAKWDEIEGDSLELKLSNPELLKTSIEERDQVWLRFLYEVFGPKAFEAGGYASEIIPIGHEEALSEFLKSVIN